MVSIQTNQIILLVNLQALKSLIFIQLVIHGTPQSSKATVLNSRCSSSSVMTARNFFSSLTLIVTFYITFWKNPLNSQDSKWFKWFIWVFFGKHAAINSKIITSLWIISATFFRYKFPVYMYYSTSYISNRCLQTVFLSQIWQSS